MNVTTIVFDTINNKRQSEDRRKLLALARDALNSDYVSTPE